GNGHADLLTFISATPTLLRLRQGQGDGTFDAEHILPIAPARRPAAIRPADRPAQVGSIIQNGRGLRLYRLHREPPRNILQQDELYPQRIPLPTPAARQPAVWTIGDFDGNGYEDLCVSSPDLGQLHVFPAAADGLAATPLTYATLSGVSAISLTGGGDLLVFSSTEKTAALHSLTRMDEFPQLLPPPGPPLLAVAHPARDAIYWLCRDPETRQAYLTAYDLAPGTNTWLDHEPIDLPNDPETLLAFPLPDDRVGLMFFTPHQPPLLLACDGQGELSTIESASFNPAARPLRPAMMALPGLGRMALALDKLAREFIWHDQSWQPVRQLSPGTDTIQLTAITPFRNEGSSGLLLLDQENNDLLWFADGAQPIHRVHSGFPLVNINGMGRLRGPNPDADEGLVLLTASEIFLFHNQTETFRPETDTEYASAAEDPALADFRLVRLDQPLRPFIALTDISNRALELLALDGRHPSADLVFEVFQAPEFGPGARSGVEPREVAAGDITGNGIGDLAVLVHDKLIIYRGE
ncbi:MAG: hypothetical protein LC725_03560, partial [Lentisphaerae bacterium]|nr:hypothetical protein [Lentisphaerota bacterium]